MNMVRDDPAGAYVPGPAVERFPLGTGPLAGKRFAVKDLFDIAGVATTYGNPDWARTHPPPPATAPVVTTLLEAGAQLTGKTKTVELAYGLTGENPWHGTPLNPKAPTRFPGGSSCGSAAAVAAGMVDFTLGSDTGGSVRIPASYCGIYGIRPSYGALSLAGARPLAPSYDTAGWFAPTAAILAEVGAVLLPGGDGPVAGPLLRTEEAWLGAMPEVAEALRPALARLEAQFGASIPIRVAPEGLATFHSHFRATQAEEVWVTLGGWIIAHQPQLSPRVAQRFEAARSLDPAEAAAGRTFRRVVQARFRPLLDGGAILVHPTSPCPAPLLTASPEEQLAIREATIAVTAIAGFCGFPEVSLPVGTVLGAPVGLSLVAGVGRDRALLDFTRRTAELLSLP